MNILVTMQKNYVRDTFLTEFSLEKLKRLGNVTINPYDRPYTRDELKEALKGIDIVFAGWGSTRYDEEILDAADSLKIIAYCAGTLTYVASPAIYERGIVLLGANCVFAESVAECCVCYTMLGLRRIEKYARGVREGGWRNEIFYNEGIMDRTIGLVGFGAIAKKFVGFLKPFRTRILVHSGHLTEEEAAKWGVEKASLEQLFKESDVVSIHQGLTERTFHMVNEKLLRLMKKGALLINTARGAVVEDEGLIKVLEEGHINAVLDVMEHEPPAPDSPLRKLENVTVLPHMGGPTIDRRQYCVTKLVEDIEKYLAGEKLENLETYVPESQTKNMTMELGTLKAKMAEKENKK